jgi:hypothetical protein
LSALRTTFASSWYSLLESYMSSTTGNLSCMSYWFRLSLENCLLYQQATRDQFHTTAQPLSRARRQQAGFWMPVVVSTRGHWDGPMICNEAGGWSVCSATWSKVPCAHAKAPCLGHSPPGSEEPTPILVSSSSCAAVGAGACLEWGSASDRLWNWAGANQVLRARVGRCGQNGRAPTLHLCWFYECYSLNVWLYMYLM